MTKGVGGRRAGTPQRTATNMTARQAKRARRLSRPRGIGRPGRAGEKAPPGGAKKDGPQATSLDEAENPLKAPRVRNSEKGRGLGVKDGPNRKMPRK